MERREKSPMQRELQITYVNFCSQGGATWTGPPFKCGLHKENNMERVGKGNFSENLTKTHPEGWAKATSTPVSHVDSRYPDTGWWEWPLTSVIFLPKTHSLGLIMRKASEWSQLGGAPLPNISPVTLKTVRVTQGKESLRKCHSQEKPKETWQLNVITCSGWGPGTNKRHQIKKKKKKKKP